MAVNVQREPTLTITLTLQGQGTSKGYMSFHMGEVGGSLPDPQDTAFLTYVAELIDNVEGASDCRVIDASVSLGMRVTGQAALGASPEVERKGVFQFQTNAGFPAIVTVPGLSNAALANDGVNIQRTGTTFAGSLASSLQGIHDKLQNGMTIGVVTFPVVDRRGSDFNGLLDAYQQTRKNSRG